MDYPGGSDIITKVLLRGKQEVRVVGECDHRSKRAGVRQGRGHKPSNAGGLGKQKKARIWILPQNPQKEPTLPTP